MTKRRLTIPAPSEARLPLVLARRVLSRDGARCVYFGIMGEELEVDHVRPRAHSSSAASPSVVNESANLVSACADCNAAKGPQDLAGFGRMLEGRGVTPGVLRAMKARVRRRAAAPLPTGRGTEESLRMALALSLEMSKNANPLPARYHVRVLVLREDGWQLTDDDKSTIRESLAKAELTASKEPAPETKTRRAPAKQPTASSATKPSPKRAAAKRPTR